MSKDLVTNNIWGIVIDDNGNVVWKHNLPKEIPLNYSLQDVATFLRVYRKLSRIYMETRK